MLWVCNCCSVADKSMSEKSCGFCRANAAVSPGKQLSQACAGWVRSQGLLLSEVEPFFLDTGCSLGKLIALQNDRNILMWLQQNESKSQGICKKWVCKTPQIGFRWERSIREEVGFFPFCLTSSPVPEIAGLRFLYKYICWLCCVFLKIPVAFPEWKLIKGKLVTCTAERCTAEGGQCWELVVLQPHAPLSLVTGVRLQKTTLASDRRIKL